MPKKSSRPIQILPTDLVLSVRQPFAQLLVPARRTNPLIAEKWIENRTWAPPLSSDETHWILIHASSTRDDQGVYDDELIDSNCPHGAIVGYAKLIDWLKAPAGSKPNCTHTEFKKHCDRLRDIVEQHSGIRPDHGIRYVDDCRDTFHWVFVEPTRLDEPIPCSGKLRLWTIPESLKSPE